MHCRRAWGGAIPVPIINFFCSHGCCTTMTLVLIPILPPVGRAEHTHTRGGLEHPPQSGLVEQFSKDGPPIQSWSVEKIQHFRQCRCGCQVSAPNLSCLLPPLAAPSPSLPSGREQRRQNACTNWALAASAGSGISRQSKLEESSGPSGPTLAELGVEVPDIWALVELAVQGQDTLERVHKSHSDIPHDGIFGFKKEKFKLFWL